MAANVNTTPQIGVSRCPLVWMSLHSATKSASWMRVERSGPPRLVHFKVAKRPR